MTHSTTRLPELKLQEIPFGDTRSAYFFSLTPDKPFVATVAAVHLYGHEIIVHCLHELQRLALEERGIDYLQVFTDPTKPEPLWFIEDCDGAITALLPSDY